jgi:Carboxypeptidase regulatory-like domain
MEKRRPGSICYSWMVLLLILIPGLTWAGSVTGTVTDAGTNEPMADVWVMAHHYDSGDWGNGANTNAQGYYTIDGLPAGDYRVQVDTVQMANVLEEFYNDSHDWNTASRVAVTAVGTTPNIDMALDYGFSHSAQVMNIHQPNGSFITYFSFEPYGYVGTLPGDITSVTVETWDTPDTVTLEWDPVWNEFSAYIDGSPVPGMYVFTATMADGHQVVSTDYQYVVRTIPNPDTASFVPAEGAVVSSKTPSFSWDPIDLPGVPLYYRFEVAELDGATGIYSRVWASNRSMGMTAITLKEGLLAAGGSYYWRVRVTDSDNFVTMQNRANSAWVHFTVADTLDAHDALPAIDPNNWNGLTWTGGTSFAASVKVIDLDGVAFDGSSHSLRVTPPVGATFPDGSSEKYAGFDGSAGPTSCYFWLYVGGGTPASGEYTFTVTDPEGNETSFVEQVDVATLDIPDETSITPSNVDHYIMATFDNVHVNGVLYDDFDVASLNELDPAKWKWPSEAAVVGSKLQFDLHDFVGRGNGSLAFTHIEPITSVQADTAVTSVSDSRARAQIAGAFFNDGSNADFWMSITNDGSNVSYNVSRQWFNHEGNYQWETVQGGDLIAASLNDVVTLGVTWNEGVKTLTFSATNQNTGASQSADYVHSGPVYPVIANDLALRARINLTTNSTPTFTWDPVVGASRYRLRIYTYDNSRIIWNGYTGSETSYTVPPGVLTPDSYYRYRLDAWDAPSPLSVDNYSRTPSSSSDFYRFYTNSEVPEAPFIDLDGGGVQTVQSDEAGVIPAFWVRVSDLQGVPGNIASVKVKYPGGHEEFLYLDHTDGPYRGYYHTVSDEPVGSGVYIFTVTDRDGNTATVSDDLVYNPIAYPAASSLAATVGPDTIQVSWDAVEEAAFYRLEIYNEAYERIYRLNLDAAEVEPGDDASLAVPRGLLEEGKLYRYRIKTHREFYSDITGSDTEGNNDNSSQMPWRSSQYPTFVLSPVTGGSSSPTIDLDNQGVSVFHAYDTVLGQDTYILSFLVKVTDTDGIPGNINRVYATLPNATTVDLVFDESLSDTEAYYYADLRFTDIADIVALEGDYTFTVVDRDNPAVISIPDKLSAAAANMLATPANLSPAPDALVDSTTPTISWDAVAGATSYRVRLFTSWHSTLLWSDYIAAPATSWEVPYGVLEPGTVYAYRVYAYRGGTPVEDLDFASFNLLYFSWSPHFAVSTDPDSDGDGLSDSLENTGCTDPDDADTDDDGILDGIEDANHNGVVNAGETNPCNSDSDGDGIQDGTEVGLTLTDVGPDTAGGVFIPDVDPASTTDPTLADSDGDGTDDGDEDANHNGRVDAGESDPNVKDLKDVKAMPFIPLLLLDD